MAECKDKRSDSAREHSDNDDQQSLRNSLCADAYGWQNELNDSLVLAQSTCSDTLASLGQQASNYSGQTHLIEESSLALALGANLRSWRQTPWPVASVLAGSALLFFSGKLDPTSKRNAYRNRLVSSCADNIINHREVSQSQCAQVSSALAGDCADLLVTSSSLLLGAFPRVSRSSCATLSMYASEACRLLWEREPVTLEEIGSVSQRTHSMQDVNTWITALNKRGLRATVSFDKDGSPILEPPKLSQTMPTSESTSPYWWRDPLHANWQTSDSDIHDISSIAEE